MLFIRGMVNVPVVTTFVTELPDMVPKRLLAKTATLAGPPLAPPAMAKDVSMKSRPAPEL